MKKYLILTSIIALFSGEVFGEPQHVTILHFNDLHGHLEQAARIASVIKKIEKENEARCYRTYVLFGGDLITGTAVSDKFGGKAEGVFLNGIGTDAMVAGNHDFDNGSNALELMMSEYRFPVLAANVFDKRTGELFLRPYIIDSTAGCDGVFKAGIFGIAHKGTPFLTNRKNVDGLVFTDPVTAARKAVKDISKDAELVVALTHEGVDNDVKLAKKVDGIDVVIGGHDHVRPDGHCRDVGKVPVCQTPANGTYIGRIDITVDGRRVVEKKESLIRIDKKTRPDKDMERSLSPFFSELDKEMKIVITRAGRDLSKEEIGTRVSEAMRDYMGADLGVINSGGIRKPLKKGKVTVGDLVEVLPFPNIVLKIEMKGRDIQNLLKYSRGKKSTLFFAGLDSDGKLESNRAYTVAIVDFLKNGGDGYGVFKKARVLSDSGKRVRDIFTEHIKENGI